MQVDRRFLRNSLSCISPTADQKKLTAYKTREFACKELRYVATSSGLPMWPIGQKSFMNPLIGASSLTVV